jgi:hypothetical protein
MRMAAVPSKACKPLHGAVDSVMDEHSLRKQGRHPPHLLRLRDTVCPHHGMMRGLGLLRLAAHALGGEAGSAAAPANPATVGQAVLPMLVAITRL